MVASRDGLEASRLAVQGASLRELPKEGPPIRRTELDIAPALILDYVLCVVDACGRQDGLDLAVPEGHHVAVDLDDWIAVGWGH